MKSFPTLEAKWVSKTQPSDGGHLLWTGSLGPNGSPVLDYRGKRYQASRIAFTLQTGRQPRGSARPSCGIPLCVLPRHIDDQTARYRDRLVMRALLGLPLPPARCGAGHDQAGHGRFRPDGKPYCQACARARKTGAAA